MEPGKKILLVEDEALIGMSEAKQLSAYGYNVTHVLSGEAALESFHSREGGFDLVLMDIDLGNGLDGPSTAIRILKEYDVPIIFLSSHGERDVVESTENISSFGYVIKNSNSIVLNASIGMAFKLHEAQDRLKRKSSELDGKNVELAFYEKRYRRLFESAQDGILILNAATGMIVDVNPFLISLLGYSKEEFLEKRIWDLNAFKHVDYAKRLFKELQTQEYVRYADLPLETVEGRLIHVEFVSNVYLVDSDKVIQCNIRDIEERIRRERELTDRLAEKDVLLKELQHRTKNSFSLITSLIGLQAEQAACDDTRRALEALDIRTRSISQLYTLLYDTDSIFEIPLGRYCENLLEYVRGLSDRIVVRKRLQEVLISAKEAANIGMIIVELVTNSVKYAFPDGGSGAVDVSVEDTPAGLRVTVEDDGAGFDRPVARADEHGLGLQIVDLLAAQLGGTLRYESAKGTRVVIDLPPRKR